MLSAGRSSDMTAGRELQIRLSYLNSLRLNPAFPTARWRDQLAEVAKLSIEEGHFLEESRTSIVARASKAPTDPEQFIQWFEELKESGPGQQGRTEPRGATVPGSSEKRPQVGPASPLPRQSSRAGGAVR